MELWNGKQLVRTPYGLLGADENALTYALGHTFKECPALLDAFLRDLGIRVPRRELDRATIKLQQHSGDDGVRGITDIEVSIPDVLHVIVEAKVRWSLPTRAQLAKYPLGNAKFRKLVMLTERDASEQVRSICAQDQRFAEILACYPWQKLMPHCRRLRRDIWIQYFLSFIEKDYHMKSFSDEVWIVSASNRPLWSGGLSHYQTHMLRGVYHQDPGQYDLRRPIFIAFRTSGEVTAIHRVTDVLYDKNPVDYIPELEDVVDSNWPREPHTIWRFDPNPIPLPRPLPTGDKAMRARHVLCDVDLLLDPNIKSVREIELAMKVRRGANI